jgi:membrane protein implicated in regulation of membrane protease activity
MIKMVKFLEKMWLMIGILTILIAVYKAVVSTWEDALYFLVFSAVAFLLFWLRRRQRHGLEKNNSQ